MIYTKEHQWLRIDDTQITIGITDFAQENLNDILFVELPEKGSIVAANQVIISIESTKTVSELTLPFDAIIIDINPLLDDQPELVNSDPLGEGWMIKIVVDRASINESEFFTEESYNDFCNA